MPYSVAQKHTNIFDNNIFNAVFFTITTTIQTFPTRAGAITLFTLPTALSTAEKQ